MDGSHNIGGVPLLCMSPRFNVIQWPMDGSHIIGGMPPPDGSPTNQCTVETILCGLFGIQNSTLPSVAPCFIREQGFKIVCRPGAYSGLAYNATAYGGPSMVDIGPGQYLLRAFIWDPSHFPIYEDPHITTCCWWHRMIIPIWFGINLSQQWKWQLLE